MLCLKPGIEQIIVCRSNQPPFDEVRFQILNLNGRVGVTAPKHIIISREPVDDSPRKSNSDDSCYTTED